MKILVEVAKSFTTGFTVGAVFAFLSLPVPAPAVLAGVTGVMGLWAGYAFVVVIVKRKQMGG